MGQYYVVHAFACRDKWMTDFVDPNDYHAYPVTWLNFSDMNRMNINIRHIMTLFISEFDLRTFLTIYICLRIIHLYPIHF
jgi:hypothetical protein